MRGRERGQAVVEMALVMPVLLVVLFAVIEFGFVISDQMILTNAARDGARTLSTVGGTTAQASTDATAATTALKNCGTPTVAPSTSGSNPATAIVTVSCAYQTGTPLGPLVGLLHGSINATPTLSATVQMRVEQ